MRSFKRALAILLCLGMATSLAGCAKPQEKAGGSDEWQGLGGCYTAEKLDAGAAVNSFTLADGRLFYSCYEGDTGFLLNDALERIYTAPGNNTIFAESGGSDGIWLLESHAGETPSFELKLLSPSGKVLMEKKGIENGADGDSVYSVAAGQGRAYLLRSDSVVNYDLQGNELGVSSFPKGSFGQSIVLGTSGKAYVALQSENGADLRFGLYELDGSGRLSAQPAFSYEGGVDDGFGDYEYCLRTDDGLYGCTADGAEPRPLVIWDECGIALQWLARAAAVDDGFVVQAMDGLWRISPVEPSQLMKKTVLTIGAVVDSSSLSHYIVDFNSQSEDCFIEIKDYLAEGGGVQDAITRLNLELLNGGGPDLIYLAGLNPKQYAQKGFLLDLYDLMDKQGLKREDYYGLEALEVDGKLPSLAANFYIKTLCGSEKIFGSDSGWSYEDYLKMQSELPAGSSMFCGTHGASYPAQAMYSYALGCVNWKSGECSLDPEIAGKIFDIADTAPTGSSGEVWLDESIEAMQTGAARIIGATLFNPYDFVNLEKQYDLPLSIIGYPTADGSFGSTVGFMGNVGISTHCDKPEAAWKLLEFLLDYQSGGFSLKKAQLQAELQKLLHPYERFEGKEITVRDDGTFDVEGVHYDERYDPEQKPVITEAQAAKIQKLLDMAENSFYEDEQVKAIVEEEMGRYKTGSKSREETLGSIEKRIALYASEQK